MCSPATGAPSGVGRIAPASFLSLGNHTNTFIYQYLNHIELGHTYPGSLIGEVDPHRIRRRPLSLFMLRISDGMNVAHYELAASMIAVGLSWRQALPAMAIGHIIISWAITANGTVGARLRVPFP